LEIRSEYLEETKLSKYEYFALSLIPFTKISMIAFIAWQWRIKILPATKYRAMLFIQDSL